MSGVFSIDNLAGETMPEKVKTFKEVLQSYNKLSELCFVDCVSDLTSRTLKPSEDRCATNCLEKFLKFNQRVSDRFQEFQLLANENERAMYEKLLKASS